MKLDHTGIAVRDMQEAISFYTKVLGGTITKEYSNPAPGVASNIAVIEFDDAHIELLTPTSQDSPIARFLKQRGKGVHHIAYRVDDLDQAIAEAKQQGLTFLEDTYRTTPFGRRLIYMNPRHSHGVITELCDYPENS
ncbi:methylmalonyl-CoA epimerase [Exiguobacterium sp.]|uniref:methylmalonyl-CoA epimerase n=1 Tax=Exiguobacterium sp. TaxID=44751 RepID=UPI0028AD0FB1|nr:methylmalonyl-CoA epimerase [Exiguobacterium sp.]